MIYQIKKAIKKLTPAFLLGWYHFLLAFLAAFVYGWPSKRMAVIGVVGTRGKTTAANFIWAVLSAAGYKTGLTGTANIRIGDEEFLNRFHMTMPGRFTMQKLLKQMADAGCEYAIIETPSEGVEQWRHKGIIYDILIFTGIYPEYLAAHKWSFERCKEMNLKVLKELFNSQRKKINNKKIPKVIIANKDNEYFSEATSFAADRKISYAIDSSADFQAGKIKETLSGGFFAVDGWEFKINLIGKFNILNVLPAVALANVLEIKKDKIKKGLGSLYKIGGRMEEIKAGQKFSVFVDYAHDVVSLEAALEAAAKIKKKSGRIILLLGAEGGGRDKKKRPLMGELAAQKADLVVISNVDPYDDEPSEILESIARPAEQAGKIRWKNLFVIENRTEGIRQSLVLAQKDDIVLITGKGAEQAMIIGSKRIYWDDRKIVGDILKQILTSKRRPR